MNPNNNITFDQLLGNFSGKSTQQNNLIWFLDWFISEFVYSFIFIVSGFY